MPEPREFDIPPCPKDLKEVVDAGGNKWRIVSTDYATTWTRFGDDGLPINIGWNDLVRMYGPLKEVLKPVTAGDIFRVLHSSSAGDEYWLRFYSVMYGKVQELLERYLEENR